MYLSWLLLTLALRSLAQPPQYRYQKPDPSSPNYQQQVAASIQSLVSGRRTGDPVMSGASTGRLILEGAVESFKIYRDHKRERAQEAKEKEEEDQRRRDRKSRHDDRSDRSHRRNDSRRREHRHRSHRDRLRDENGERRRRRVHHMSSDDRDGHRRRQGRHRSGTRDEHGHRRRHRSRSREDHAGRGLRDVRNHGQPDQSQQQRSRSDYREEPGSSSGQHKMSSALHVAEAVAEQLFGPDGTPFGSLPIRGKGIGLLAHSTTMYRHIKAEQDAGYRSEGFVKEHVHKFLGKRRDGKSAVDGTIEEKEVLTEKDKRSRSDRGGRERRRRYRSNSRQVGRLRGYEQDDSEPIQRAASSGARRGIPVPSQPGEPVQHPTPFTQQPPRSVLPTRRKSLYGDHTDFTPILEREKVGASQSSRRARGAPSVRVQSLVTPTSVMASRVPTPLIRDEPSVRDLGNAGVSQNASCIPTTRVQLPTPPKQANPVRSHTPSIHGTLSRVQSPEPGLREPAAPGDIPAPAQHNASPPPMPTSPPAFANAYPVTPSVVGIRAPSIPVAHLVRPFSPHLPPQVSSEVRPNVNLARDAFLASIQLGMKLKKVNHKDRKDEAGDKDVARQTPVYAETPHSHNVEALEYAQAVEEMERRQEGELTARTKTPLIAPQPQTKIPTNFQDELAAKLGKINLNEQRDDASEAGTTRSLNVISSRASNETWRTVFVDDKQHSEPNEAFRERLGNTLSAERTPRPSTAATTHGHLYAREVTLAPDVFVDLSTNIAGPGWQSGPSWGFDNVPSEGSD